MLGRFFIDPRWPPRGVSIFQPTPSLMKQPHDKSLGTIFLSRHDDWSWTTIGGRPLGGFSNPSCQPWRLTCEGVKSLTTEGKEIL